MKTKSGAEINVENIHELLIWGLTSKLTHCQLFNHKGRMILGKHELGT